MSTELVILLSIFVFIMAGVFKKPAETFRGAGPHLGARLEMEIETAPGFMEKARNSKASSFVWSKP